MFALYFKKALQDILRNRFLNIVTIITIAISILIVSAFALFIINAHDIMTAWKKGIHVMAYLKPDTDMNDIKELQNRLGEITGVKNVLFISKHEALERLKSQLKNQSSLIKDLKENPLPDAFEIILNPSFQKWEKIKTLAAQVESMKIVDEVEYGRQWLSRFIQIFNLFKITGYSLIGLFFFGAIFIVANTIRLVIYSRRDEVEIMRLVGACDRFIKTPFYIEGIIQGALGGVLGVFVLSTLYMILSSNVSRGISKDLFTIRFLPVGVFSLILLSSMLVGWIGCYISLKQYLKL
jgi:cell division transport system permease protein